MTTQINNSIAIEIVPFIYSSGIPIISNNITHLGVFDYTDDLQGNCKANFTLISDKGENIVVNSYVLKSEEYSLWDSSPEGLLIIIGKYLQITLK